MKIVINPKYGHLSDFINRLPFEAPVPEEVYQDQRNNVYKVTVSGVPLVVKKYKRPTLANCVIYTWFRMGKAERSYEYAFRLREAGFETAEPVAYIIIKKCGFLHTCYFVSTLLPYPLLREYDKYDSPAQLEIIDAFAAYSCDLHKNGIVHYDYNLGNVLFHNEDGRYEFALIDINRMAFGRMSRRKRIRGLKGLGFPLPLLSVFIERYTQLAGLHTERFFGALLLERGADFTFRLKRRYKAFMNRMKKSSGKKQ